MSAATPPPPRRDDAKAGQTPPRSPRPGAVPTDLSVHSGSLAGPPTGSGHHHGSHADESSGAGAALSPLYEGASAVDYVDSRASCLVACIGVMLTSGGIYLFSAYSSVLAERLNLSNTELQVVAAMGNLGQWLAVGPGLLADKVGPRRGVMIGAVVQCLGLGAMGMAFDGVLPGSVYFLALYNFCMAQGTSTAYIASMKSTQMNFNRADRGRFVGLLASFFGLSSGAFSLTYKSIFQPYSGNLSIFFYCTGLFTLGLQYACSTVMGPLPKPAAAVPTLGRNQPLVLGVERRRALSLFALTIAVLVLQLVVGFTHVWTDAEATILATWVLYAVVLLGFPVLVLFAWPIAAPVPRNTELSDVAAASSADTDAPGGGAGAGGGATLGEELLAEGNAVRKGSGGTPAAPTHAGTSGRHCASDTPVSADGAGASGVSPAQPERMDALGASQPSFAAVRGREGGTAVEVTGSDVSSGSTQSGFTLKASLVTADFWLLFVALSGGLCFSIVLLNNLGGIVASLSADADPGEEWPEDGPRRRSFEQRVGALVVVFSCANVSGRLGVGFLADRFQPRLTRVAWVAAGCILAALGNALMAATMSNTLLEMVVPLAGLSMGALFGTAPLSTTDMFGLAHYAAVWGVIVIGPCLPTIAVATVAAGHFSDLHAADAFFVMKDRHFCLGRECYRMPMVISFAVSIAASAAAVVLALRRQRRHGRPPAQQALPSSEAGADEQPTGVPMRDAADADAHPPPNSNGSAATTAPSSS